MQVGIPSGQVVSEYRGSFNHRQISLRAIFSPEQLRCWPWWSGSLQE